jgi:uncharacterized membrane protein
MIEHLQNHTLGLVHTIVALAAIVFGTLVVLNRKGTRNHRWMGYGYLFMMFALNGTALLDYELFGYFGPFHWMALASLVTVILGFVPVWRRKPGWVYRHANFMAGSYVGLLAAAGAEVGSRIPGWSFGPSVIVSSIVVVVLGIWIMRKTIPQSIRSLSENRPKRGES